MTKWRLLKLGILSFASGEVDRIYIRKGNFQASGIEGHDAPRVYVFNNERAYHDEKLVEEISWNSGRLCIFTRGLKITLQRKVSFMRRANFEIRRDLCSRPLRKRITCFCFRII